MAPGQGVDHSTALRIDSPVDGPRPTRLPPLVPRLLGTVTLPDALGDRMEILRDERLPDHPYRPLDARVLDAGVPYRPLLPPVLLDPHPLDWRRLLPVGAEPCMPLPPVLGQALGVLLRRDVVHAGGTALLGLVRGFPSDIPVDQVQHGVAPPLRRALGWLRHFLECHGYGWCARRRSPRASQTSGMPGVAFPPVGPVGGGSPPSSVRCAAQTTPCPARVASLVARCPRPCLLPACVVSPSGRGTCWQPPGPARAFGPPVPQAGRCARRQGGLPRSRVTPLTTCPALRPRWCPGHSPGSHPGLLPSGACQPSAFASLPLRLSC